MCEGNCNLRVFSEAVEQQTHVPIQEVTAVNKAMHLNQLFMP